MTRGLLAGVFFGVLVAALILAVAALQLEHRRAPDPVVMTPPEVLVVFGISPSPTMAPTSSVGLFDPAIGGGRDALLFSESPRPRLVRLVPTPLAQPIVIEQVPAFPVPPVPPVGPEVGPEGAVANPPDVVTAFEAQSPAPATGTPVDPIGPWPSPVVPNEAPGVPGALDLDAASPPPVAPHGQPAPVSPPDILVELPPSEAAPMGAELAVNRPGPSAGLARQAVNIVQDDQGETGLPQALPSSLPPRPAQVFPEPSAPSDRPGIGTAQDGAAMAIVLRQGPASPVGMPDWALSVALTPERIAATTEAQSRGQEVITIVPPGADRGALSGLAWNLGRLVDPGPLFVTGALANDLAVQDLVGLAKFSGAGILLQGQGLDLLPTAQDAEVAVVVAYPEGPLPQVLIRAKRHAERDGAVILVVEDSATVRTEVAEWLHSDAGNMIEIVPVSQALARLRPGQ